MVLPDSARLQEKDDEQANKYGHSRYKPARSLYTPDDARPVEARGAIRYYDPRYEEGFRLECRAMKLAREWMGLTNVKLMGPFCRTAEEGRRVPGVTA